MLVRDAFQVLSEARAMSEAEFGRAHAGAAFAVEPIQTTPATAKTRDETTTDDTNAGGLDETQKFTFPTHRSRLHPRGRVFWPRDEADPTRLLEALRVGRDPSCELVIENQRLSRHHATIRRLDGAGWTIEDNGSTNGSALNDRVLVRGAPLALEDGDYVLLAQTVAIRPFLGPGALHRAAKQRTVLVVDDSRAIRSVVKIGIRGVVDECLEAGNGEEALQILEQAAVDLVISDAHMPVLDGLGLLRRLRESARPALRDIPVVVLSADDALAPAARQAGATDFLWKNRVRESQLLADTIGRILTRRE